MGFVRGLLILLAAYQLSVLQHFLELRGTICSWAVSAALIPFHQTLLRKIAVERMRNQESPQEALTSSKILDGLEHSRAFPLVPTSGCDEEFIDYQPVKIRKPVERHKSKLLFVAYCAIVRRGSTFWTGRSTAAQFVIGAIKWRRNLFEQNQSRLLNSQPASSRMSAATGTTLTSAPDIAALNRAAPALVAERENLFS